MQKKTRLTHIAFCDVCIEAISSLPVTIVLRIHPFCTFHSRSSTHAYHSCISVNSYNTSLAESSSFDPGSVTDMRSKSYLPKHLKARQLLWVKDRGRTNRVATSTRASLCCFIMTEEQDLIAASNVEHLIAR